MSLIGKIIKIKDNKYVVEGDHEDTLLLKKITKSKQKSENLILKLSDSFEKTLKPADSLVYGKQLGYASNADIHYPESLYDLAFEELNRRIDEDDNELNVYYIDEKNNEIQESTVKIIAFDPTDDERVLIQDNSTDEERTYTSFRTEEILRTMIFAQECEIADQLLAGKIKLKDKSLPDDNDENKIPSEIQDEVKEIIETILSKTTSAPEDLIDDLLKELFK